MIFVNDPFELVAKAFSNLYPDKKYMACFESQLDDVDGKPVYGFTQFSDGEIPVIAVSAELTIKDATEIFAHELAHVAAGKEDGHGEKWEQEFEKIFQEYHRIGKEMFEEQDG